MNERDAATEALIREVDEDLKREQAEKIWKKYGKYIVGGAILLILGVAGNEFWGHWKTSRAQAESAKLAAAVQQAQQSRDESALAGLDLMAKDGRSVYATLASMKKAGFLVALGDRKKSVEEYQAAAKIAPDALYAQSAKLHALFVEIDSGEPARLEAELAPLAADKEPWRHSARELQALLALRLGNDAKALDIFTKLADDASAPQGLRSRAAELRQAIEAKGRS